MSIRHQVRAGLIWSSLQNWFNRTSSLVLFAITARVLTPEQFGTFAALMLVVTVLTTLSEQGMGEAVVQKPEIAAGQLNFVFLVNMAAAVALSLATIVFGDRIAQWAKAPQLDHYLWACTLLLPLSALSFVQPALRRRALDYRPLAKISMVANVTSTAVAVALLMAGAAIWSLVAQAATNAAVTAALLWRDTSWRPSTSVDARGSVPILKYGGHRLGSYLLDLASTRYIEAHILAVLGPAALAMYAVGAKISTALSQIFSATVLDVAHSGFSKLVRQRSEVADAYYRSLGLTALVVSPVFVGIAAAADVLNPLLFGNTWQDSAQVTRMLCLLGAVQMLQFYNGTLYNAMGKPQIGFYFLIAKTAAIVGGLSLSDSRELTTMLWIYVSVQLLTTPVSFWLARRLLRISLTRLLRELWPMICGCIALWFAMRHGARWLQDGDTTHRLAILAVQSGVGATAYLCTVVLLRPALLRSLLPLRALKT